MRVCICPNMGVVAAENLNLGEAGLILNKTTAGKSGFSLLWCAKHNKLVLMKVTLQACCKRFEKELTCKLHTSVSAVMSSAVY
jgi:hypothetical protein